MSLAPRQGLAKTGSAAPRALALTDSERALVRTILARVVPEARVQVYGSRAGGRVKPFSDLDLALDLGHPVPLERLAELREAFDLSDLTWKVDLTDLHTVDPAFAAIIAREALPLEVWPEPTRV
jgi:predicted nucleotidyltransferase